MSIFKCKMCGGTLEINPNQITATCEYCGMEQTLPRLDDERRANLYDRANHFRRNNDFDKAAGIYEQILNEDTTDAEAYWSLVLCRYGIEYVEDPASRKRVPTVNRAQFTSVFNDDNYKSALNYSDGYQRSLYEAEAAAINDIQKGILAISQQEKPFDVFICYKESDANGRRTPDSVLANELYHQLVQEGFKVFYSRITLEDKLGVAYEPYIFAALNSAKVMVVLGTRPEYFKAVWVRNEWSRYLALVKQSRGQKVLIPAYKDMDPYDLPEEFSHLQAQDMSKLGFMQDLIRGIKKLATPEPVRTAPVAAPAAEANIPSPTVTPLLRRVFMYLEDGEWQSADEYCEKVLDLEPENAQAYLGKLMAELKCNSEAELADCDEPFIDRNNYCKVMRFGDEELIKRLDEYIVLIKGRKEEARIKGVYEQAVAAMSAAKNEEAFNHAYDLFKSVLGYRDSDGKAQECLTMSAECVKRKRERDLAYQRQRIKLSELKDQIIALKKQRHSLGIFDRKKRKYLDAEIERLNSERAAIIKARQSQLETIKLGGYTWNVLDRVNGKALVISRDVLKYTAANAKQERYQWDGCLLRTMLNSSFLALNFSLEEQKLILPTETFKHKGSFHNDSNSMKTTDRVFVLSIDEAEEYFWGDSFRRAKPTPLAKEEGAPVDPDLGTTRWILRSPGINVGGFACINTNGEIDFDGISGSDVLCGVRPAMWINLDS